MTSHPLGMKSYVLKFALWTSIALGLAVTRLAQASPPTAPGALSANGASSTQIALSWTASTDDASITSYIVQRCQGAGCSNFTQVASLPGGTAFLDSGLSPGATYQYEVYATDSLGASSSLSNVASATTLVQSAASSVNYAYDVLGRLVQATVPALNIVENYAYDAGGNLLSVTSSPISALAVASVSTTQGSPGSTITIYGSGFSTTPSADIVNIGGTLATVISATSTQLVVSIPAGATNGPITVTTGSNTVTSSASFTVTAAPGAPTISSAPALAAPGSKIVITGTGFQPTLTNNQVFLGVRPLPVISATPTVLTVAMPVLNNSEAFAAAAGIITVTTPFGTAASPSPVVIASTNFGPIGSITVGGTPTPFTTTASQYFYALTFNGTAGQNLTMSFTGVKQFRAGIYAPDGSSLLDPGNVNSFTSDGGIQIPTLPTTGTYVMEIWSPNVAQTVNISVQGPVTATLTLNGSPANITTTIPGQSASLTFAGTQGTYISLNLSSVTFSSGIVQIINPDGSILSSLSLGTSGGASRPQLPATGTYTVLVIPSAYAVGSFTATLSTVSSTLAANQGAYNAALTSGTPTTIPFDGTPGQYLSLAGTPSAAVTVTVQRPDGSQLTQAFWSACPSPSTSTCGAPVLNMGPLTQTGTYTVTLSSSSTGNLPLYLTTPLSIGALTPNTFSTSPATLLGQAVMGTITDTFGDYPAVMVSGGYHYANSTQWMQANTTVLAQDGSVVVTSNTSNELFPLSFGPLQQNNTYTVLVQQTQALAGQTIAVEWLPAVTPLLPTGPNPPAVALLSGQSLAGTFTGISGQYAEVNIAEGGSPASQIPGGAFYIVSPAGAVIGSAALSTTMYCAVGGGGNTACGEYAYFGSNTAVFGPLPQTGPYTVVFQTAATSGIQGPGYLTPTITLGPPGTTTVGTTTTQTTAGTTFSGTAGQFISIDLSSSTQTNISLLGPTGAVIAGPLSASKVLTFGPLPTTGTYTVLTQNAAPSVSLTVATPVAGSLALGTPSTASITLPGQGAQYTFSGAAGQYYTASVSETTGGIWNANVSIVSSSGATVASTTFSSTCTSTCTGSSTINFGPLSANDTYSLLIQPTNLYNTAASSLTLQVTNNAAGNTTTQSFSTSTAGASAQFTFQGAAGESFTFALSNMVFAPSSVNAYTFQVTAPNGANFYSTNCAGGTCSNNIPVLTQTGVYTVTVTPSGSATMTGSATISTALRLGPITIGNPLSVSLASGQAAVTSFTATAGQTLSLAATGVTVSPSSGSYNISVQNAAGQSVAYASTSSGTTVNLPNLAAGTYAIAVYPAAGYPTTSGSMQLTLAAGVADTLPLTGNGVIVSTPTVGDNAYFTFPAVAGQGYSFTVSSLSLTPSSPYGVTVYSPSLTFGGGQTNCYAPGCVTHLAYATQTQNYTITVVPGAPSTINFVATLSPDVAATLSPNVPLNISLGDMGQIAMLSFNVTSVTNPALLLANFTPNPSSATYNLSVYNVDQSYAYVNGSSATLAGGTPGGAINLPTLQPGSYIAIIKPNTPAVATLQLTFDPDGGAILPVAGSTATVTTSGPGEYAYLSFDGTAGQSLTVALTNLTLTPSTSSNLTLVVTNPNGTQLLSTTCSPTAHGCELTLPFLPQTGTYTVTVEPPSSSAISFTAAVPPAVSGSLTTGVPVPVQWTTAGQSATLSFTLASQQTVAVNFGSVVTVPANTSVSAAVYNSSGVQVGQTVSSATGGTINLPGLAAGAYEVVLTPTSPVTGSLQVTLEPGVGGSQPTDGTSTTYTTPAPGQNAYITFSATAGQSINVAFTNLTLSPASPNDISWSVTAPDGSTTPINATTCYTTGVGCTGGILTIATTGTYTVKVLSQGPQTMSFTTTIVQNLTGTITSGTTQALNLSLIGQDARYAFTAVAGQGLSASLSGITTSPANVKVWMGVYTPSGAYVTGADTTTGEVLNLGSLAAGNYILWIGCETPATGSMQLAFQGALASTVPADGSSNNVSTGTGQNAYLTFTANAGDSITGVLSNLLLAPNSPTSVNWALIYPNGSTAGSGSCSTTATAGCFVAEAMTLSQSGTYSVNVTPAGPQAASFTLNVAENLVGTLTPPATQAINFSNQLGQAARFTFTVSSGQSLSAVLSNVTTTPANTQVWMGVYTPAGSYVTGSQTSTGETLNLSSLSPGNYLLWIGNITPATASMQLSFH